MTATHTTTTTTTTTTAHNKEKKINQAHAHQTHQATPTPTITKPTRATTTNTPIYPQTQLTHHHETHSSHHNNTPTPMNLSDVDYSTTPQHTGGVGLRLISGLGLLVGRWRQASMATTLRMSQAGDNEIMSLREFWSEMSFKWEWLRERHGVRIKELKKKKPTCIILIQARIFFFFLALN